MQQKLISTILCFAFLFGSGFAIASLEPNPSPTIKPLMGIHNNRILFHTIEEFLSFSPKQYAKFTGKKMSLVQKISLKILQYKVKKAVKKGKKIDLTLLSKDFDGSDFNLLGFILGLLLGPIGLILALIVRDSGAGGGEGFFKWTIYGAIIWLGIVLLVLIL